MVDTDGSGCSRWWIQMVQDIQIDGGYRCSRWMDTDGSGCSRWWIQMVQDVVDGGYRWFRM